MLINDDGLQIIDEEERRARVDFYADHSIGWTARPKHGSEGFLRRGKFKKVWTYSNSVHLFGGSNFEERWHNITIVYHRLTFPS